MPGRALGEGGEARAATLPPSSEHAVRGPNVVQGRQLDRWYNGQQKGWMNMAKEPRRIAIGPETDLLRVLEEVHADKEPRVVEKEGEAIAAIISMEDFATALGPSEEGMAMALEAAGAWKDLDTDSMVEAIYRARHESRPSTPVRL